jgi:hypothetical protein
MRDNELIAEFMGGHKQVVGEAGFRAYERGRVLWWNVFPDCEGPLLYLEFDDSWDWLMPVVEKIELDFGGFVIIHNSKCVINPNNIVIIGASKLEAVYKAVVEFIEWHNHQSK